MVDGHTFTAYLPGGASGGLLPANKGDLTPRFRHACRVRLVLLGPAPLSYFSDQDDVRAICKNLLKFFEDESCGQCTPCRVGCEKMLKLMDAPVWDQDLIKELSQAMMDASICGLGPGSTEPGAERTSVF